MIPAPVTPIDIILKFLINSNDKHVKLSPTHI